MCGAQYQHTCPPSPHPPPQMCGVQRQNEAIHYVVRGPWPGIGQLPGAYPRGGWHVCGCTTRHPWVATSPHATPLAGQLIHHVTPPRWPLHPPLPVHSSPYPGVADQCPATAALEITTFLSMTTVRNCLHQWHHLLSDAPRGEPSRAFARSYTPGVAYHVRTGFDIVRLNENYTAPANHVAAFQTPKSSEGEWVSEWVSE